MPRRSAAEPGRGTGASESPPRRSCGRGTGVSESPSRRGTRTAAPGGAGASVRPASVRAADARNVWESRMTTVSRWRHANVGCTYRSLAGRGGSVLAERSPVSDVSP